MQVPQARVKLASMLGTTFLEVSIGEGPRLTAGGTIRHSPPRRRTPSPTSSPTATTFCTTSTSMRSTRRSPPCRPSSTKIRKLTQRAMEDTAALARLIGDKDDQIDRLLTYTRKVTGVVHDQQSELDNLLVNAEKVTGLVQRRRDTIERLGQRQKVVTTLDTMADDNDKTMRTLLNQFDDTLGILQTHSDELGRPCELGTVRALLRQRDRKRAVARGRRPLLPVAGQLLVPAGSAGRRMLMIRSRLLQLVAAGVVAALLLVAGLLFALRPSPQSTTFTLQFTDTTGLYVGNDVQTIGVRIGEVTKIQPKR